MSRRGIRNISWILLSVIAAAIAGAAQNTINVPADVATIQGAINAANPGDTVLVAPGTYFETLNFNGKMITVTSSAGADNTIIDGGGIATVVTFNHSETADAVLSGFTIRNGKSQMSGGGVEILNASPTIRFNTITGNYAIYGVGVHINGGSPAIRGNVITDNHQCCGTSGFGGGGIAMQGGSTTPAAPQITANIIMNNSVAAGGSGGGIDVTYFSSPLIQNNYIAGNNAYNYGGGINLSSYKQSLVIQNVITNNSAGAGGSGGGISFLGATNSLLLNNTLYGNQAFDGTSEIFVSAYDSAAILTNNAVQATAGNALTCAATPAPAVTHNLIYSPTGVAFAGNCSGLAGTNGNLATDPLFVNAVGGDYHLQPMSPAIDAGDNSAANLPKTDDEGHNRIVDGNGDGVVTIDLGVSEYDPGAAARISPNALAFGNENIQTYSAPQTVKLTNTGTVALVIQYSKIEGPFFPMDNNCGGSLAPGASCTFAMVFAPNASGSATGTLTVITDTAGVQPTLALSGTGVTPVLTLSTGELDFLNVLAGTTSASQPTVISNTGDGTLYFAGFTLVGAAEFAANGNCGNSLAPGASCTMSVTYSPTVRGQSAGSYYINVEAPAVTQRVALYGVGVAPLASLSIASVAFGSQIVGSTSASAVVNLSNTGDAALAISTISATAPFAQRNNCPALLPVGTSCAITVTFTPSARGSFSGPLTVIDSASGSPHAVALSGTGIAPVVSISPPMLGFGSQPLNTTSPGQYITISNTGDAMLNIFSTPPSVDFLVQSTCVGQLGPGGVCSMALTFNPTALGLRSGTLTINDDAPGAPQSIRLDGYGVDFGLGVSAATIARGESVNTAYNVTPLGGPYPYAVNLTCSGLPKGSSCYFAQNPANPGANPLNSTLTIYTSKNTPVGTYPLLITGTSAMQQHSVSINLVVNNK